MAESLTIECENMPGRLKIAAKLLPKVTNRRRSMADGVAETLPEFRPTLRRDNNFG